MCTQTSRFANILSQIEHHYNKVNTTLLQM